MDQMKKIGVVASELSISIDTLRYYEKILLLEKIKRTNNGLRLYSSSDIKRIIFIKEAQKVGFSLEEISQLLTFREKPKEAKPEVRALIEQKFAIINQRIAELTALRDEFTLLTEQCLASEGDCPILSRLECKGDKL
jgi:DNA-binding transcriptional MerR regulator